MRVCFFLLFFLFQVPAIAANATVNCSRDRLIVKQIKLPSVNISVGNDSPNGTVIYSGFISDENDKFSSSSPGYKAVSCKSTNTNISPSTGYFQQFAAINLFSESNVYPTNLPGVGVRFKSAVTENILSDSESLITSTFFPIQEYNCTLTGGNHTCYLSLGLAYNFDLIKTGFITAGSIDGFSFPMIIQTAQMNNVTGTINGFPMRIGEVTFYGNINITTPTCTAKNVFVDFQRISVNEISKNSHSKWFDSSIYLTDCPVFYGYSGSGVNKWSYNNSAGTISSSSPTNNNMISYNLTPLTSIIDMENGIVGIDNISNKASGVGIQISKGNASNNSILNFTNSYSISVPKTGQSIIGIPLVSRVVKLNDNLTSGLINAQVVFTINYQ